MLEDCTGKVYKIAPHITSKWAVRSSLWERYTYYAHKGDSTPSIGWSMVMFGDEDKVREAAELRVKLGGTLL